MPRIAFNAFAVQAPRGWSDISDQVEVDNPPYSLAHRDGVGALQFSIALYEDGPVPNPSPADLLDMLREFGRDERLGKPTAMVTEKGPPRLAAGSFDLGDDFQRHWYLSDGRNFAFVTYTCTANDVGPELATCEQIVRSIIFADE
jgi:hypothetical protein